MSHATLSRTHLSRTLVASGTIEAGLAVKLGTLPHVAVTASPGEQSITGVSATRADDGELVTIAEGHSILPVKRDPAFTAPVVVGDRLGVGAGGAFVLANGAQAVVIVQEPDDGTGSILVEVAPFATSVVGQTLINRTVAAGESGAGGVLDIPLGFTPLLPLVQRQSAAGNLLTLTATIQVLPNLIRITSQNPNPFDTGDVAVIFARE